MLPDVEICDRARLSRDARFDGMFFTGVLSTGIFCRPICPARPPLKRNVRYFPTAAEAVEAGLRPCLRCRPEAAPHSPEWRGASSLVERALALIRQGFLNENPVDELADRLAVGSRHLRRLFKRHVGASPVAIARTHRTLLAKALLSETELSITQIALASGFGSLRQFNSVFRDVCGVQPRDIRRQRRGCPSDGCAPSIELQLGFRPPYDWNAMLAFWRQRIIPGVESVSDGVYRRTIRLDGDCHGWLAATVAPGKNAVSVSLSLNRMERLMPVLSRVRRMFDLDADMAPIHAVLARDPLLAPLVENAPGLRLPGAWDPFEFSVRAVLGQQISVKAATTIAGRIADRFGFPCPADYPPGLTCFFPSAAELHGKDLGGLGLTGKRTKTLGGLIEAVSEGKVPLEYGQEPAAFEGAMTALAGIGPWTACYVAMRALGMSDAFPASDLGIVKALSESQKRATARQVLLRAEAWRPFRAYAAIHLWNRPHDG